MIAVLENPPTYVLRGFDYGAYGRWENWHWVKMTDLLAAANRFDYVFSKKEMEWTARGLGETFRAINKKEHFYCYIENEKDPTTLEWRERHESKDTLFTKEGLYVPHLWSQNVLKLVRAGVREIKLLEKPLVALVGDEMEVVNVSDLLG